MLTALIALGIFTTVLLLAQAAMAMHRAMFRQGTDRAVERLQQWSVAGPVGQLDIVRKESLSEIPWLHEFLVKARQIQPLRLLHQQADCRTPLGMIVLTIPILACGAMLVGHFLLLSLLLKLLLAGLSGGAPVGYLYWCRHRRLSLFEQQLPDALELVSRALRAGHALSVGLKLVGEETVDPVRKEFRRVYEEVSMGVALPQALQNMTERINSVDLRFFVVSVLVQRETGGNLAEIIDSLAGLIRQRFELALKVRAISAEGRLSAVILFGLPIVIALLLYKLNPEYISLLFTDPMGQHFATIGSILMVLGAAVMKRMVMIRV
jgi:tight adherence protein B